MLFIYSILMVRNGVQWSVYNTVTASFIFNSLLNNTVYLEWCRKPFLQMFTCICSMTLCLFSQTIIFHSHVDESQITNNSLKVSCSTVNRYSTTMRYVLMQLTYKGQTVPDYSIWPVLLFTCFIHSRQKDNNDVIILLHLFLNTDEIHVLFHSTVYCAWTRQPTNGVFSNNMQWSSNSRMLLNPTQLWVVQAYWLALKTFCPPEQNYCFNSSIYLHVCCVFALWITLKHNQLNLIIFIAIAGLIKDYRIAQFCE